MELNEPIIDEQTPRPDKKAVVLALLAPYYKDPSTCGYQKADRFPGGEICHSGGYCSYLTEDGRSCVFGKCLISPEVFRNDTHTASDILINHGEEILKEEYRNIFTHEEWNLIQHIHDCIAKNELTEKDVSMLGLITKDELAATANNL
jgi:hypothetical protein